MAITRQQKEAQVKDLAEKMGKADSVVFAHYLGLSVAEISELRSALRKNSAHMQIAKKTLMKRAAKESKLPDLTDDLLTGAVSCIFSFADALSGAKAAFAFAKTHPQVRLIGGIFEGRILSQEEAVSFAQTPGREELLTMFVSMLRSPLVQFAGMCGSPLSGFARSLNEIAKKKSL